MTSKMVMIDICILRALIAGSERHGHYRATGDGAKAHARRCEALRDLADGGAPITIDAVNAATSITRKAIIPNETK